MTIMAVIILNIRVFSKLSQRHLLGISSVVEYSSKGMINVLQTGSYTCIADITLFTRKQAKRCIYVQCIVDIFNYIHFGYNEIHSYGYW